MIFSNQPTAQEMRAQARAEILNMLARFGETVYRAHASIPEADESRKTLIEGAAESLFAHSGGVFKTLLFRSGYVFGLPEDTVVDCVTFYDNQPLDVAKQMLDAGGLRGGIDLNTGQIHT